MDYYCEKCGTKNPKEIEGTGDLQGMPASECCNTWITDVDGNPKGLEGK